MAKNFISDLSPTAASNTDIVGQDVQGSANVSGGDNALRNLAQLLAKFYDDLGGVNTVAGTGDAITVTAAQGWTAYGSGEGQIGTGTILAFKAGAANTGATTVNVNALGIKKVRLQGDSALGANAIVSGGTYLLKYDAAYDTAAGAWVLLNPGASSSTTATTTNVLTGTDTSAYVTSDALAALWEKGSNIASSGTISIGEGGLFHITGTTTITDIDFATAKDGRGAWLIFDGALTLTHNATTLVLPGGANITTAAGDMAYVVQDSSDNVYVRYFKADGTAVVSSGGIAGTWTLIGTITMNSSPETQALGGTYKELFCVFASVETNSSTATVNVALTDDGVTYDTARTITIAASATSDFHDGHLHVLNTGVAATTKRILPMLFTKQSTGSIRQGAPYVTPSVQSSETGITHSIRFDSSAGAFSAGTVYVYGLT